MPFGTGCCPVVSRRLRFHKITLSSDINQHYTHRTYEKIFIFFPWRAMDAPV